MGRNALDGVVDVADFVAARDDDGDGQVLVAFRFRKRTGDHDLHHAQPTKARQAGKKFVQRPGQEGNVLWKQQETMFAHRAKAGEFEESANVVFADPVGFDEIGAQADFAGEI